MGSRPGGREHTALTSKGWVKVGWGIGAPIVTTIGPGQCVVGRPRPQSRGLLWRVLGASGTGAAGAVREAVPLLPVPVGLGSAAASGGRGRCCPLPGGGPGPSS